MEVNNACYSTKIKWTPNGKFKDTHKRKFDLTYIKGTKNGNKQCLL